MQSQAISETATSKMCFSDAENIKNKNKKYSKWDKIDKI